jgi:PAS domain S-box-containing protein
MVDKRRRAALESEMKTLKHQYRNAQNKVQILESSEKRFRDLVDNAIVGIYRTRENGEFLFANKRLAEIFGFESHHEFLASLTNASQLYANPKERAAILNEMKTQGFVDGAEIQFRRRDGKTIWISVNARAVKQNANETLYEGFIVDITERKQALDSLHESEKRFRLLVEQAGDAFFIHDYAGKILDVNRRACETLGYTRQKLLDMEISDVDLEIQKKKHRHRFWEPLPSGQYITFEGVHRRKDGSTFPVEVRLGRVDLGEKALLLSLTRDITDRKRSENELKCAFEEIKALKNRLEEENIQLRQEIEVRYPHKEIVGESMVIKKVLNAAEKVAKEDTCVLIMGETGTGKEILARAIHNMSPRKGQSMIRVNCAALPATLIESELFGREKGAFTGAVSKQIGRFEAANRSTIFLDEIGDLPWELQAKLLRVLQDNTFERLGSSETISVNVRVIAATNHNLAELVRDSQFRRDLYYRLNVFPITVPPLRERREDIPLMVWAFVEEFSQSMGKSIKNIPKRTMDQLLNYYWPGNVRELKNVVERAMIMSPGTTLHVERLEAEEMTTVQHMRLEELERNHIKQVLESTGWRISGMKGAARLLDLKVSTLRSRMKKLGIERP